MLPTSGYLSIFFTGLGGFVYYTLPRNALFSLAFAGIGVAGIAFNMVSYFRHNGLFNILPTSIQELLLEKSLIDFIAEGRLQKKIKEVLFEIFPLFLARTNEEREEALSNLSKDKRKFFTTTGLVNTFSDITKRLLLPQKYYRNLPKKNKIVYSPSGSARPSNEDLDMTLIPRFIASKIGRTNKVLLRNINPRVCRAIGIVCAFLVLIQIRISKSNREVLYLFSRVVGLFSSIFGFLLCFILFFLHNRTKSAMDKRNRSIEDN